ncbi:hypothetical protein Hbl1158_15080 (plasmid) [Halobaculum sp. CBA1158]|uniref:hypothetical protein n=1 Tax=Halobaculum sp. CBA1158 TaxID=2904243 RepID=UPI001F4063ED|nr:hypothetical protein [Halobaculum sp. CBA1158]UIP01458.1 hypothetical protein Hbl1158_15080 [Halobaculum sp. CBA1158]
MRLLIFANTPAHVHLYRNAVSRLCDRGHDVLVLGRDDGCAVDLLEYHDLPYELYGRRGETRRALLRNLPGHYARILRRARSFDPDLIFGMGAYAAPAGVASDTPVIAVQDSEPHGLDYTLSRLVVDAFLTPYTFARDLGPTHYRVRGFKESAYLHPDVYAPECDIRAELGVDADEPFVVVRFNGWGAYHDVGRSGFDTDQRRTLLERLAEHATVVVTDERDRGTALPDGVRPFDVHPAYVHDALAAASLLVADTQTMVTEAALLGTPALRSNSFVGDGDMGNFRELAAHGLVENVPPSSFDRLAERAVELLTDDARAAWRRRREAFVDDLIDLTALLVDLAEAPDPVARLEGRPTETITPAIEIP